ncbi:MAG: hydrogenase maturation nickel metallochaperone HypA [Desulfovibrio sp.]|nr:hydrogenase maturation nickel metallochaperone HypA [Desulfovibrio sp.]
MPVTTHLHYRCRDCGHLFTVSIPDCNPGPRFAPSRCPNCGSFNFESLAWDGIETATKAVKTIFSKIFKR